MTTWRPDTCECEIEYDNSTFVVIKVHKKCEPHSGVADDALYEVALKDNQTKNAVYNGFIEEFPEHTEEIPQEEQQGGMVNLGTTVELEKEITRMELLSNEPRPRRMKKGIKMLYVFTGKDNERHLQAKFHGVKIPSSKKNEWEKKLKETVKHNRLKVV